MVSAISHQPNSGTLKYANNIDRHLGWKTLTQRIFNIHILRALQPKDGSSEGGQGISTIYAPGCVPLEVEFSHLLFRLENKK